MSDSRELADSESVSVGVPDPVVAPGARSGDAYSIVPGDAPSDSLPLIMGIVNVTPDSFSDGGRLTDASGEVLLADAVGHAAQLVADGSQILDVGGESTRPGSARVPLAVEQRRVIDVIEHIRDSRCAANATDRSRTVAISVDTLHAETASAALDAGASIINDVSGGLDDPQILNLAADRGVQIVLGHWRGHLGTARDEHYDDIVDDVANALEERMNAARLAGVTDGQIAIDPGFGFSKGAADNWRLLAGIDRIVALGAPVVVGVSRKRMTAEVARAGAAPADRDLASALLAMHLAERGVWAIRAHDADATRQAIAVVSRVRDAATSNIGNTGRARRRGGVGQ